MSGIQATSEMMGVVDAPYWARRAADAEREVDRLRTLIRAVEQNDAFMKCCPWCGEQALTRPPEWDTYCSVHSVTCPAFTTDGQVK